MNDSNELYTIVFSLKFDERNNKILFSPSFFSSFDENRLLVILSRIIKLF